MARGHYDYVLIHFVGSRMGVMKIADASKGFVTCFLLNMLFNFEWGLFALILYLLHLWLNIPLWIALALLGVWLAISLTLAILVTVAAIRPSKPRPKIAEKYTAPVKARVTTYSFGPTTAAFIRQQNVAAAPQETILLTADAQTITIENDAPYQDNTCQDDPFYHGTKADLKVGDFLEAGHASNFGDRERANFIYLSATMDAAVWGAELALGEGRGRIYIVEPTGPIEDDPNLTDKRFPGNPTRSYRTREPLHIVGEVPDWQGHTAEELQRMRKSIEELHSKGQGAINE